MQLIDIIDSSGSFHVVNEMVSGRVGEAGDYMSINDMMIDTMTCDIR